MLFLTEIKHQKRPASSQHNHSASATRFTGMKFTRQDIVKNNGAKSKSVHNVSRQQKSNIELQKEIDKIKNRHNAKEKWHKIVQIFHLFHGQFQQHNNTTVNTAVGTPKLQSSSSLTKTPIQRSMIKSKTKYWKANKPFYDSFKNKLSEIQQYGLDVETNKQQLRIDKINIFECILKLNLNSHKYRINIPQTVLLDENRVFVQLKTQNEFVVKKSIHKADILNVFEKAHQNSIISVKQSVSEKVYSQMYENKINTKINPLAPFVVICFENNKKNLSMEIENSRNFGQNRWDSNRSAYVQRYIFSRNLKAMVMRIVFQKRERGQQRQQYSLHRFQNYAGIFRNNSNGQVDFLDFKAKVSPSYSRQYTLQYSKLTGPGVLNQFIVPSAQIRKIIEGVHKKKVKKLWIDYAQDIAGKIWLLGVKGVQYQEQSKNIEKKSVWEVASQVGCCRLCNSVFQKSQLQNSVSVRMLLEFLHHLRRRTKFQDLQNLDFVNLLALNRKENAMSAVCECCYALIIRQLQLKKYQRQLGRLCNIKIQDQGDPPKTQGKQLYQWRLMVYLEDINQQSKQIFSELSRKKHQHITIRYVLSKGMQQKWKCKIQQKKMSVQKVKIHYLFSEMPKIQDFLKNTQILVSVLSGQKQEVIAQGSTGILGNFRNNFVSENGQRQTTTVLLFFESGKYCALTLKVGLAYDGLYKIPQMPMKKIHSVLFPAKQYLNSNPLPKQWMESFGYDKQIQLKEVKYEQLLKDKINSHQKSATGLKKKTMRHYW